MLFELDDTNSFDLKNNYFNLNEMNYMNNDFENYNDNNLDLDNGFYLGNIFKNTYKQYKNYKPKRINVYSNEEKLLLRIYELDFILNDLNLYLDIYPNDKKIFEIFKDTAKELNSLKDEYYNRYQVLDLCKDLKNKYTWLDNPWPWDGGKNV